MKKKKKKNKKIERPVKLNIVAVKEQLKKAGHAWDEIPAIRVMTTESMQRLTDRLYNEAFFPLDEWLSPDPFPETEMTEETVETSEAEECPEEDNGEEAEEEEKDPKAARRAATRRHVLELEAIMKHQQLCYCLRMAENSRKLENRVKGEFRKRLEQLWRTKKYRGYQKEYKKIKMAEENLDKNARDFLNKLIALEEQREKVGKKMNKMQKKFGITRKEVKNVLARVRSKQKIPAVIVQTMEDRIWASVSSVLYDHGKKIHFRKYGDYPELRAKQINRCFILKIDENGVPYVHTDFLGDFYLKVKKNDIFAMEELQEIVQFMEHPEMEDEAVERYVKTGEAVELFRSCYIALSCRQIRGKMRVFVHITIEGKALEKKDKHGNPRHDFSKKGVVGVDLGTQSIAVSSGDNVLLENLAERNEKSTRASEAEERRLRRKMDRSRRTKNPDNYNKDGTVKPWKERKPWEYSNNYKRTRRKLREICRKNADSRKYANRELANRIRAMGDEVVIEKKNAKKLQKKAKESKVTVREDGTKKHSRRKRFGKSIQNRCPGALQADLKKKFGEGHYHEVPYKYRASQYDHTAKEYIKKELNDRLFVLKDGTKVQRDMYSSFLLMCAADDRQSISQERCEKKFQNFLIMQNNRIQYIKDHHIRVCNSGIRW